AVGGGKVSADDEAKMKALGDQYNSLLSAHRDKLEKDAEQKAKDAQAALATAVTEDDKKAAAKNAADAEKDLKKLQGDKDAFAGADLPRNEGTKGDKRSEER